MEDLEIRGCRRLQQEWESGELATWNGSTERGGEKKITLGTERYVYISSVRVYVTELLLNGWTDFNDFFFKSSGGFENGLD